MGRESQGRADALLRPFVLRSLIGPDPLHRLRRDAFGISAPPGGDPERRQPDPRHAPGIQSRILERRKDRLPRALRFPDAARRLPEEGRQYADHHQCFGQLVCPGRPAPDGIGGCQENDREGRPHPVRPVRPGEAGPCLWERPAGTADSRPGQRHERKQADPDASLDLCRSPGRIESRTRRTHAGAGTPGSFGKQDRDALLHKRQRDPDPPDRPAGSAPVGGFHGPAYAYGHRLHQTPDRDPGGASPLHRLCGRLLRCHRGLPRRCQVPLDLRGFLGGQRMAEDTAEGAGGAIHPIREERTDRGHGHVFQHVRTFRREQLPSLPGADPHLPRTGYLTCHGHARRCQRYRLVPGRLSAGARREIHDHGLQ